jgi:hypothetical protein
MNVEPTPVRIHRSKRSVARRSALPYLDVLEDRSLLSTFTVTNLLDCGPGSLRAGIQSNYPTITFCQGLTGTISLTSELLINRCVTIVGPGASQISISGNNSVRDFEIASGQVAISGLTITGGKATANDGGGILIDSGASLSASQVAVTANFASADCLGNFGSGGGIENDGCLSVCNSVFTNNVACGGSSTDPITEGSAGGAIDSQGPSLFVTGSTFSNNNASGPATGTGEANGGAINTSSSTTIACSTFTGNSALGRTTNGGAIAAGENEYLYTPPMTVSGCTFASNEAVGANGANDFTISSGGEGLGGAIFSLAQLTITGSSFKNNLAQGGNGGNSLNDVSGYAFEGTAEGGAIWVPFSTLNVTNTSFVSNRAVGGNCAAGVGGAAIGGAIAATGFTGTGLINVSFVNNQVKGGNGGPGYCGGSAFGGGLYSGVDAAAILTNTSFSNNLAQGGAGGCGAPGGAAGGGAIANGGGLGVILLDFLGIPWDSSVLEVNGGSMMSNIALGGTGGAGAEGGSGEGGGTYVFSQSYSSFDDTLITLNAALGGNGGAGGTSGVGSGGALYIGVNAVVPIDCPNMIITNYDGTTDDHRVGIGIVGGTTR